MILSFDNFMQLTKHIKFELQQVRVIFAQSLLELLSHLFFNGQIARGKLLRDNLQNVEAVVEMRVSVQEFAEAGDWQVFQAVVVSNCEHVFC